MVEVVFSLLDSSLAPEAGVPRSGINTTIPDFNSHSILTRATIYFTGSPAGVGLFQYVAVFIVEIAHVFGLLRLIRFTLGDIRRLAIALVIVFTLSVLVILVISLNGSPSALLILIHPRCQLLLNVFLVAALPIATSGVHSLLESSFVFSRHGLFIFLRSAASVSRVLIISAKHRFCSLASSRNIASILSSRRVVSGFPSFVASMNTKNTILALLVNQISE